VDPTKFEVILRIPTLKSEKEVHSLLGKTSYYRRFIENYSRIASPLFSFLSKDEIFLWTNKCQTYLIDLKKCLVEEPILRGLDCTLPFHVSLDDFDMTIGVVLGQREENNPYAIYYTNNNLTPIKMNYTVENFYLLLLYMLSTNFSTISQVIRYFSTQIIQQLDI
jgi:hypothetical protein